MTIAPETLDFDPEEGIALAVAAPVLAEVEVMDFDPEAPDRVPPKWAFCDTVEQANGWTYRDYQIKAILRACECFRLGYWRILLVLATGLGKTVILTYIAGLVVRSGGRALIIADKGTLLYQAGEKLKDSTGHGCEIEMADQHASLSAMIVMGSVQTLSKSNRLEGFPRDHFDLMIVDETHRAMAPSFRKILDYFTCPAIGFTATPERGDKKCLSAVYEKIKDPDGTEKLAAFEMGIVDGVRKGWLVRLEIEQLDGILIDANGMLTEAQVMAREKARKEGKTEAQIAEIIERAGKNKNSDFAASEVAHRIAPFIKQIAKVLTEKTRDRAQGIIFMPSVELARMLEDAFLNNGVPAVSIAGEDKHEPPTDRRPDGKEYEHLADQKLSEYKRWKYKVLINVMLYTEGFDHDRLDWVVCLRLTKILGLYQQIVGRGTRPLTSIVAALNAAADDVERRAIIAKSAKPKLTVYDILYLTDNLDITTPAEILARNEKVAQKIREEKKEGDIIDIEEEANRDLLAALEKAAEKNKGRKGRTIDPLALAVSLKNEDIATYVPKEKWEWKAPSPNQLSYLEGKGMDVSAITTFGMASKVITIIKQRESLGLCSPKQMKFLATHGKDELVQLGIEDPAMVTAEQATKIVAKKFSRWGDRNKFKAAKPAPAHSTPALF